MWGALPLLVTGSAATKRETGNGWKSVIILGEMAPPK